MNGIRVLWDNHKGETGYIVGKGPSLLKLRAEHFEDGPIIAINQAIQHVEALGLENKVYALQKNPCDEVIAGQEICDGCESGPPGHPEPEKAPLLLSFPETHNCYSHYPDRFMFTDIHDLGFKERMLPSLPNAARILERMGVDDIKILCCDAIDGEGLSVDHTGEPRYATHFQSPTHALAYYRSNAQRAQESMSVPFEWVSVC